MDDQGLAVVEPKQQILGAPVDGRDGAAFDLGREARRQRHPQVLAALDQAGDAMADHARDQAAADGFDFRQLGHGVSLGARTEQRAADADMGGAQAAPPSRSRRSCPC